MKNFLLFAALCSLATAVTTILIHNFPYGQMTFEERAMLYQDATYFKQRLVIIAHCSLFLVAMWGAFLVLYKKALALSGLGLLFFALFSITETIRQVSIIFYLNGLREKYFGATGVTQAEIIKIGIENFGFINYTLYAIFIVSFGLGALFYGLALLQLKHIIFNKFLGILMLFWSIGSFVAFGNVFWGFNWLDKIIEPYNLYYQSLMRILIAVWLWRIFIEIKHKIKQKHALTSSL